MQFHLHHPKNFNEKIIEDWTYFISECYLKYLEPEKIQDTIDRISPRWEFQHTIVKKKSHKKKNKEFTTDDSFFVSEEERFSCPMYRVVILKQLSPSVYYTMF